MQDLQSATRPKPRPRPRPRPRPTRQTNKKNNNKNKNDKKNNKNDKNNKNNKNNKDNTDNTDNADNKDNENKKSAARLLQGGRLGSQKLLRVASLGDLLVQVPDQPPQQHVSDAVENGSLHPGRGQCAKDPEQPTAARASGKTGVQHKRSLDCFPPDSMTFRRKVRYKTRAVPPTPHRHCVTHFVDADGCVHVGIQREVKGSVSGAVCLYLKPSRNSST